MRGRSARISVLMVGGCEDNRNTLQKLARSSGWDLEVTAGCESAVTYLQWAAPDVVLCEEHLADGDWTVLLELMQSMSCASKLVLVSRFEDDRIWGEVLSRRVHDVVLEPFDAEEVRQVVSLASIAPLARRPPQAAGSVFRSRNTHRRRRYDQQAEVG